ncbi:MAG TPA: aromatic ring-hydroxylating dioxygenase subunit alpha [Alphaproteobacteria bacterium]|nr:aromatic ring-hydroxylating dioxygenase subunit alpha [Alphaproteobacteria bacterium]
MAEASELFRTERYDRVRNPIEEAEHLPASCYTSPEFYQREAERIFRRAWNFLGRADQIPKAGDYFTADIAGIPIIVVRCRDGVPRALANTCRHRGALLLKGAGRCTRYIACPYHSWSYALDGALVAAPGMEGVHGFDRADFSLQPVRLETWDGFMFVNFDSDAESLASYLGDLPAFLQCYGFGRMRCVRRKSYSVNCNWKLLAENSIEDYHTATVHRHSIGAQKLVYEPQRRNWAAAYYRTKKSIATLPASAGAFPWIPTLTEKARNGTYFVIVYPATTLACNQDGLFWVELYPRGPARTEVVVAHAFPETTIERPDFEEIARIYYERCDLSIPEDNGIAELQHQGLQSPLARPGRVSRKETLVHAFANWVLDRVLDGETVSARPVARAAGRL